MRIKLHSFAIVALIAWAAIDLLMAYHREFTTYSATLKILFIGPLCIVSLPMIIRKNYILMIVLLGISTIITLAYPNSYNSNYSLRLFIFILIFFAVYTSLTNIQTKNLINCIFAVITIVFLATIISVAGGTNSVYADEGFGGGAGGFSSANQYSYLLILLLSIVMIYTKINTEKKSTFSYFFIILAAVNCIMLTTKASVVFSIIIITFFLVDKKNWFLLFLILMLVALGLLNYYEELSVINRFLFFVDNRDTIWALTSGRSERLEEFRLSFFSFIPNENVAINYEMELFDALVNLGVFGLFFICGFLLYSLKKSLFSAFPFAITALVVLIIILSGHFFNAIAIAPYVAVYFRLLDELRLARIPSPPVHDKVKWSN